jgi:hypothetical protein
MSFGSKRKARKIVDLIREATKEARYYAALDATDGSIAAPEALRMIRGTALEKLSRFSDDQILSELLSDIELMRHSQRVIRASGRSTPDSFFWC